LKEVVAPSEKEKNPLSSTTLGQFVGKTKKQNYFYFIFKTMTMGWMLA
jgi:hypothetical protein